EFESLVAEQEGPLQMVLPDNSGLKEAFMAFALTKSPSMAALIKMFEPTIEGNEVKVRMHKANINLTEPIKIEWQLFIRQYFKHENLVLTLVEDTTIIQQ